MTFSHSTVFALASNELMFLCAEGKNITVFVPCVDLDQNITYRKYHLASTTPSELSELFRDSGYQVIASFDTTSDVPPPEDQLKWQYPESINLQPGGHYVAGSFNMPMNGRVREAI